jgi:hypothetical protein
MVMTNEDLLDLGKPECSRCAQWDKSIEQLRTDINVLVDTAFREIESLKNQSQSLTMKNKLFREALLSMKSESTVKRNKKTRKTGFKFSFQTAEQLD